MPPHRHSPAWMRFRKFRSRPAISRPEYGAVGGGFFNVTMKSGTNQYHGSVYDYFVNEILNAGTPFTNAGLTDSTKAGQLIRPRARRNDYGFTIGGPVMNPKLYNGKDKTFFFFNFEQFRETQIINNDSDHGAHQATVTVISAGYRGGTETTTRNLPRQSPLFAGEIFDPTTRLRHCARQSTCEIPSTTTPFPLSKQDPVALKVQTLIPPPQRKRDQQPTRRPMPRAAHYDSRAEDRPVDRLQAEDFVLLVEDQDHRAFSPIYGNSEGLPSPITASPWFVYRRTPL